MQTDDKNCRSALGGAFIFGGDCGQSSKGSWLYIVYSERVHIRNQNIRNGLLCFSRGPTEFMDNFICDFFFVKHDSSSNGQTRCWATTVYSVILSVNGNETGTNRTVDDDRDYGIVSSAVSLLAIRVVLFVWYRKILRIRFRNKQTNGK